MQLFKRLMATLLVLVMVVSMVPVRSFAAEPQAAPEVDTGSVTIEGTNGFGNLLSEAIEEEQQATAEAESEYEAGYTVTNLEIEGNTATVTYDSMEAAILIVALYTEDGMQMLASAKTTVTADATEATVTFEGTMPEYFLASAYLVDTYDLSPLCAAYDTPMYTREMQELLASTVNDYDADKVLNLDEDESTNFAVYAETTKIIEYVEGKNIVASVDDTTSTYVIENADEQFTALKAGDVFAYAYGENNMLIVKVKTIQVSGTTVTITGDDVEMEEVFSVMKLENTGSAKDMIVDENSGDEGVSYTGTNPEDTLSPNAWGDNAEQEFSMGFNIEKKINDYSSVSGSLGVKFKMEFEYFISWKRQFMRFEHSSEVQINVGYEFKADAPISKASSKLKLKSFGFSPVAGVYIGFEPEVIVEFTATVEFACTLRTSGGFTFEAGKGGRDLAKKPTVTIDIKMEGSIFFGIDFGPHISILSDKVAKVKLSSQVGFELTGKAAGYLFEDIMLHGDNPDVTHECDLCYQLELAAKAEFSLKIELLKADWLTFEMKIAAKKYKIGLMYYSVAFQDFGFGNCPHKKYRLTVNALDENGEPYSGAVIKTGGYSGQTNENGVAVFYLPGNKYVVTCDWGDSSTHKDVTLEDARKIKFVKGAPPEPENSFDDGWNFGSVDDTGFFAHGQCGENVSWKLDGNGLLTIGGSGAVTSSPWAEYKAYINAVEIQNGITTICANAFSGCTAMKTLTIADSVTTLGMNAFNGCTGLVEVTMPCDITITTKYADSAHASSFTGCTNVRTIHYTVGRTGIMPNRLDTNYYDAEHHEFTLEWKCRGSLQTVIFDEGITHIADYAFFNCSSLTRAEIPSTVDSVGHYAFSGCTSLQNIRWPENIVFLGNGAFRSCRTFTEIDLPDTLTTIRENTFSGCTGLTSLEIPDSVTTLGLNAFNGCTGLAEVTMPCDITISTNYADSAYSSSFTGCTNVRKIHYTIGRTGIMPNRLNTNYYDAGHYEFTLEWKCRGSLQTVIFDEGITHIADYAFLNSTSLTEAVIPATVESFGHYAFSGCKSLTNIDWPEDIVFLGNGAFRSCETFTEVDLPDTLTTIRENTFSGCIGLVSIEIPDSVTTLGLNAFNGCTGLKEVTIPCDVTISTKNADTAYSSSFTGCTNVRTIHYTVGRTGNMPNKLNTNYYDAGHYEFTLEWKSRDRLGTITFEEGITQIGSYAFYKATRLKSVTLPSTLDTICNYSFSGCTALTQLVFQGDVPIIDSKAFQGDVLTCYYPADNDTWTEGDLLNYGGTITWVPYTLDENGDRIVNGAVIPVLEPEALEEENLIQMTASDPESTEPASTLQPPTVDFGEEDENLKPEAVYEGEYGTEITESYIFKTASFKGLVPGQQYVLIALKSVDPEDPLAADNLLFVDQAAADKDGTLMFTYVQRENTAISYVVACGASNKNLKDAQITFPEMAADGELHVVSPVVTYGSDTLAEERDYVVVGTVSFTEAGTYTCYIRGIHDYTGLVECTYTVADHKHCFTTYVSDGNATCLEDGTKTAKCDYCEVVDTIADVGSALGHDWDAGVVVVEPTENTKGQMLFTCNRCSETKTEVLPELKHEHQYEAVVTAPTCTEKGYTTHTCRCGDSYVDSYVDALGHHYEGGVCTDCGDVNPDYVPEVIATGWSGATQWTLMSDGTLTVYGQGNMKNYGYNGGQPWLNKGVEIRSVVIEEGVASIGEGAFKDLTKLKCVTLPDKGLSKIGEAAFYGCTSLKEIVIPEGIYTIWEYTFKNCTSLTSVKLPQSLIKVDQGAFENCTSLPYIYFPTNVEIIGSWSFKGCTGLTEADMTWTDATKIREGAFKNCSALTTIHLPVNIQVLGDSCFYGIGATSFTVPETVTSIEAWCFARAYSLKNIYFEGDAPTIGQGAFNKITLTAYYPKGNTTWTTAIMQNYGGTVTWKAQ